MIEFKGSHFEREVILWYPIGCRQLEEFMEEHGVEVDHTTLSRWVLKYVLVAEHDAADQEHFRQITQGQACSAGGAVAWIDEKVAANAAPSEFI
jgi:transposase-like protein